MVESIIGAIFLDSGRSLDVASDVLRKLGILQLLEHIMIIADDVDVLHPITRLSLRAQKNENEITYETKRTGCAVVSRSKIEEATEEAQ